MIVYICTVVSIVLFIVWLMSATTCHARKIEYMINQKYDEIETDVGYDGETKLYFKKGNILVSESELKHMSLRKIKEKY